MFLTVMTVADALTALAPARRSAVVTLAPELGVSTGGGRALS